MGKREAEIGKIQRKYNIEKKQETNVLLIKKIILFFLVWWNPISRKFEYADCTFIPPIVKIPKK